MGSRIKAIPLSSYRIALIRSQESSQVGLPNKRDFTLRDFATTLGKLSTLPNTFPYPCDLL